MTDPNLTPKPTAAEAKAAAINIMQYIGPLMQLLPELMVLYSELQSGVPASTPEIDISIAGERIGLTLTAKRLP